jgi:hypothetical protein
MWPTCQICLEDLTETDLSDSEQTFAHRECLLRDALGGIGHVIAHDLWCVLRHDPDAGFTYRESALLVAATVQVLGVEAVVARSSHFEPHPR